MIHTHQASTKIQQSTEGQSSLPHHHVKTHPTGACAVPIHGQPTRFCCPSSHLPRGTTSPTYHDALLSAGPNTTSVHTQYLLPNFMQLASSSRVKRQASLPQRRVPGQRKEKHSRLLANEKHRC